MIRATLVFYLATLIPRVMKDCRSANEGLVTSGRTDDDTDGLTRSSIAVHVHISFTIIVVDHFGMPDTEFSFSPESSHMNSGHAGFRRLRITPYMCIACFDGRPHARTRPAYGRITHVRSISSPGANGK